MKKILSVVTALAIAFSLSSCNNASSSSDDDTLQENSRKIFALVNIPFDKYFAAETTEGKFDAFSRATQKTANGSISYGTYHKTSSDPADAEKKFPENQKTAGITYPVKILPELLKALGGEEITDKSEPVSITTSGRGKSTTLTYSGKQLLFHSGDYAYYILDEAPETYKEASGDARNVSFGKITGNTESIDTLYVTIAPGEAHHEFSPQITLYVRDNSRESESGIPVKKLTFSDFAESAAKDDGTSQTLSGLKTIIATSTEDKSYGLTALNNMFWGKSQIGFQAPEKDNPKGSLYPTHELVGKKIKSLKFVTGKEVYLAENFLVGRVSKDAADADVFTPVIAEDYGIKAPWDFVIPNLQATDARPAPVFGTDLPAADFSELKGTYEELFDVINRAEYNSIWETAAKNCGISEELAGTTAAMLKNSCAAKIYGEEAIKAYAKNPESIAFDCFFINGVRKITFDGSKISASGEKGNKVFEYEYYSLGNYDLPTPEGTMTGVLYETRASNAGEFKYFYIMPDTPASTYHIEFRYGSNKEDLAKFAEGPYAYWLAAGILENADSVMINNVITLFCEENLSQRQ